MADSSVWKTSQAEQFTGSLKVEGVLDDLRRPSEQRPMVKKLRDLKTTERMISQSVGPRQTEVVRVPQGAPYAISYDRILSK